MLKLNELIEQVLDSFNKAGILEHLVFIGSWTVHFYRYRFKEATIISPLRTRDIDIDVSGLKRLKMTSNIPDMLRGLGF